MPLLSGVPSVIIDSYEWDNVDGYKIGIPAVEAFGIELTSFKAWPEQHRDRIIVDDAST